MNEKRITPGGGRRAKRAAPTIDLPATEVQPAASEPVQQSAREAVQEAGPEPEQTVETAAGQTPPQEPSQEAPQEPPPIEPPRAATSNDPENDSWVSVRRHMTAPILAAGFAGAAAMILVLFALWLTGLVPIRYAGSTAMRARVTALEMETQALQNRAAPVVDTKTLDALTARVNTMQAAIAKLPAGDQAKDPALAERAAAADNAMKSLGVALAALNKRNDDIAGTVTQARERAEAAEKAVAELRGNVQDVSKTAASGASSTDIEALQKRIAALEQSTQSARDDIAKTGASDAAARLALSAAALRDAVFSGAPYATALAQTKTLGADEKLLAPLAPFAATGVPSSQALAQELRTLLPAMIKNAAPQAAPEGNFIERLQANASKLVRVRPVDAPAGDDAAAVLARADIAAAKADIPGALSELMKLPETTRAPAQAWIAKVQARQNAANAVRSLVAGISSTLGAK
ncbi:MAG TPA: hypothetical protein VGM57_07735 [Pseudolabrys sp.]